MDLRFRLAHFFRRYSLAKIGSARILAMAGAVTGISLVAGCGGGGGGGGGSDAHGTTPNPSATATPAPTPTPTPVATPTPTPTPAPTPTPIPIAVTVSPTAATLSIGDTTQFSATISGTANIAVTWSVAESGGGTVDSNGNYTAPMSRGTYHVVVTSQADTTKSATATVTVQSGGGSGTIN